MRTQALSVTIAQSASLSGALELNGDALLGIQMPAAWDTANLTFQVSVDGSTFQELYDGAGAAIQITAGASRYIQLDAVDYTGFIYLKVRSGTSGTPVNQTAARTLYLVVGEL